MSPKQASSAAIFLQWVQAQTWAAQAKVPV